MKKILCVAVCTMLFALWYVAEAQQSKKVPRIGYVSNSGDANNPGPHVEAFRQGLRDFGYIEGKNILVEFRSAEGKLDRIPGFVAELVQRNVDVLIATKFTSDPRRQGVHCVLLLDRAASGCPPHVCVRRTTLELAPLLFFPNPKIS